MIKYFLAAALMSLPLVAQAQQTEQRHLLGMNHSSQGTAAEADLSDRAREPGQSAFAAIQEIVSMLDSDPKTDWSKVDIDGLRRHLVDMNNVTLYAEVAASPVQNGISFTVTGNEAVRESIRRMVTAHAQTMSGANSMTILSEDHPEGAIMTVTVADPGDLVKLKGLGFFGVMTLGVHHQKHHLMIATGRAPH